MDEQNSKPTQEDFAAAFVEEMTNTTPPPPEVSPVTEPPVVEPPVEPPVVAEPPVVEPAVIDPVVDPPTQKTEEEIAADKKAAEDAEAELVKGETAEQTEARHTEEAKVAKDAEEAEAAKKADEETPKFATKQDIKDALSERESDAVERVGKIKQATSQVIEKLYPEGVDQNVYDTNGQVVKTAQDIVDRGLINTTTNEPYTYDEAAQFMLKAQQKAAENVKELENYAEAVAEKNIDLLEGNERVIAKWGDVFKLLPKTTIEKLATDYVSTQLKFDKTNSYIIEMNMTPEAFYATVMAPYSDLKQSIDTQTQAAAEAATKAAEAAKAAEDVAAKAEQDERNGIFPQRGSSNVKANTGDPMLDALVDELNKD